VQLVVSLVEQGIGPWHPVDGAGLLVERFIETCLHSAAFNDNNELVSFLIEQAAPWPEQLWQQVPAADAFGNVSCWALPALKYAVAAGCQLGAWPVGLCDELIARIYAEEVEWLHTLEAPPCGASCCAKHQQQQQQQQPYAVL
jgi:hypothetical protein